MGHKKPKKPTKDAVQLMGAMQQDLFGGPARPPAPPKKEVENTPDDASVKDLLALPPLSSMPSLFESLQPHHASLLKALEALDPEGIRSAHSAMIRRFPSHEEPWLRWADDLRHILRAEPEERADATLALIIQVVIPLQERPSNDEMDSMPFAAMPSRFAQPLQEALLEHTIQEAVERDGPTARIHGHPVGALAQKVHMPHIALPWLERALEADPTDGLALVFWASIQDRRGDTQAAYDGYCDALWYCPDADQDLDIECDPILDLLDLAEDLDLDPPGAWVPILANLVQKRPLTDDLLATANEDNPAHRYAGHLVRLRKLPRGDPKRLEAKRAMLRIEGRLKEYVRPL